MRASELHQWIRSPAAEATNETPHPPPDPGPTRAPRVEPRPNDRDDPMPPRDRGERRKR